MSQPVATSCPSCGAAATGNFCAECGAALAARSCPSCGTSAAPEARFCRNCGHALAGGLAAPREPRLPWTIAGVLSAVAIAAVVYAAGARGRAAQPQMANAGNASGAAAPLGPAPDITNLTPKERFQRLNDRVMAAAESGDSTTVITFWPMAAGAYENLLPGDRDIDTRYHMATLQLMVGQFPAALALADTMLIESPDNLLAWYVRGIIADFQQDTVRLGEVHREFDKVFDAEIAKDHEEYQHHGDMLRQFRTASGGN